uniref:Pre-mRNA splicing Prp18-interacting factor n=1 Tax=Tanacetum cinerariifolium TaxID=118510 RepID=A0A699I3N6_TANCI|nr:hypothetical protein [Tanacetum cinerariifolium]
MSWFSRCSWCEGPFNGRNCSSCSIVGSRNEFVHDPNPLPYDNTPDFTYQPPHHHVDTYLCELCGNDSHYGLDGDDDDDDYDKKSIISTNTDIFETPSYDAITTSPPILPIEDLDVSFIIRNEELNTILENESDEFIKSNVEDLVPITSESEDTSGSDSECILPSCDDFSPIDIPEEKAVTFSNPLFNSNDDFIYSDDESLSDEYVPEDNVKIYLNPLFKFDDEYISSDINPLFDEVLENIESKDSYDSNLNEPDLLVTPLFDANEDEFFDSGGDVNEINDFEDGYYDSKGYILYFESLLSDDTTPNLPPEVFLDGDLRSLSDAPIDNLMSEDKNFDPGICVKFFSPTYVSLTFMDRHYLFFTYVVRILLLNITYLVVSPFLISSRSEDTIFDPGISAFHFSHWNGTFICFNVNPNILNESSMEIFSSTCFIPNIMMIWGELS